MTSLSVVVLTYNEELNLPHCLGSVEGLAEQVYVVDSGSEDGTMRVARDRGAEVVEHPFENQAQQFNWALDHLPIHTDWVLWLAADEYLLPELREEIRRTLPETPPEVSGFYMKRRVIFQGRWIQHGGCYPVWLLRLFRRGKGRCEDMEINEHLVVTAGETRRLKYDFVDENHKGLSFWLHKQVGYAERKARLRYRQEGGCSRRTEMRGRLTGSPPERRRWLKNNVYLRMPPFLRAFIYFLYRYIFRFGFLDGREGLGFHVLQGFWNQFCADALLIELKRSEEGME